MLLHYYYNTTAALLHYYTVILRRLFAIMHPLICVQAAALRAAEESALDAGSAVRSDADRMIREEQAAAAARLSELLESQRRYFCTLRV